MVVVDDDDDDRQKHLCSAVGCRDAEPLIMDALHSRCGRYIFVLFLSSSFFCSSPNLTGHTMDIYHTLTHDVVLVRI